MLQGSDTPSIGETVVCRVTKVLDYGAFAELVEYDNIKGFVHISQIATIWIKNIRNHVRVGQIRAAKVLSLNPEKNQIDLSLTKVSPQAQRSRIEEWKQLKRSRKLIELLAEKEKVALEDAWEAVAKPLLAEYDSLQQAFQQIVLHGAAAAKGVDSKWRLPLVEMVEKNISVPEKVVKGRVELHSLQWDGVELIKEAIAKGSATGKKGVEIFYVKGGNYAVRVKGSNFKSAEKTLDSIGTAIVEAMKKLGGEAKFERS